MPTATGLSFPSSIGLTFSAINAEEDRRERRRKLGLPEELTEEEKAAEAAAAAQKAEAASKKKAAFVTVKPVTGMSTFGDTHQ